MDLMADCMGLLLLVLVCVLVYFPVMDLCGERIFRKKLIGVILKELQLRLGLFLVVHVVWVPNEPFLLP